MAMVPVSQDDPGESDPTVVGSQPCKMFLFAISHIILI